MTTVTISLPESLRDFIEVQVKTKGYGNVSEYFRGLLREAQEREADKRLETLLLESLDDPRPDITITSEFWDGVKKRLVDRVERKRRGSAKK
jgi:antitoxin ParD1/3/4